MCLDGAPVDFEEALEYFYGFVVLTVFVKLFGLLDDCVFLIPSRTDFAFVQTGLNSRVVVLRQ